MTFVYNSIRWRSYHAPVRVPLQAQLPFQAPLHQPTLNCSALQLLRLLAQLQQLQRRAGRQQLLHAHQAEGGAGRMQPGLRKGGERVSAPCCCPG